MVGPLLAGPERLEPYVRCRVGVNRTPKCKIYPQGEPLEHIGYPNWWHRHGGLGTAFVRQLSVLIRTKHHADPVRPQH